MSDKCEFGELLRCEGGKCLTCKIPPGAPCALETIRRQRQYLDEIQPFLRIQADIVAVQPVTYYSNGIDGYSRRINWTGSSKEAFDMAAQIIIDIGLRIFQADRKEPI